MNMTPDETIWKCEVDMSSESEVLKIDPKRNFDEEKQV